MESKTSDSRKSYIVTKLAIEGAFCKHILLETRNINEPLKREHIQLTFDCKKKMQSMVLISFLGGEGVDSFQTAKFNGTVVCQSTLDRHGIFPVHLDSSTEQRRH